MKLKHNLAAASLSLLAGSSALAVWGVKYEVNSGSGWTTATTIDVSGGAKSVDFRISVYHDGAMQVLTTVQGIKTAWAPMRLCNSQIVTNFGSAGSGDSIVSFTRTVSSGNAKALVNSPAGGDTILGTPNIIHSFSSNLAYSIGSTFPQQLELQYYAGKLQIGNGTAGSLSRTITLTANSFAFPGGDSGTGGQYGASFYTTPVNGALGVHGVALTPSATIAAVITVEVPCPADLNGDRVVGDEDFQLFCAAHDLFDCADPSMAAGCPADLTGDGSVDDSDFLIFAAAYDALTCG